MQLVDGAHHITLLTEDMDRLLGFYVRASMHPFQMLEGPVRVCSLTP